MAQILYKSQHKKGEHEKALLYRFLSWERDVFTVLDCY